MSGCICDEVIALRRELGERSTALLKSQAEARRYREALEWACDTCWGKEHCLDRQDQKRCLIFRALHPKEGEK